MGTLGTGGVAIKPDEAQLGKLLCQFLGDALGATAEEFQVRGTAFGAIAGMGSRVVAVVTPEQLGCSFVGVVIGQRDIAVTTFYYVSTTATRYEGTVSPAGNK